MSEAKLFEIASKIESMEASNNTLQVNMLNKYTQMTEMFTRLMTKIENSDKAILAADQDISDGLDHADDESLSANDSLELPSIVGRTKIDVVRPPPFAGDSTGADRLRDWLVFIEQLNSYFTVLVMNGTKLDDGIKLSLIIPLLRSPAVEHAIKVKNKLLSKAPVVKFNFDHLLKAMENMYRSTSLVTNHYDKLFTIRQEENESVLVFYEKFAALLNRAANDHVVHKDVAANCFIAGLFEVLGTAVEKRKIADNVLEEYGPDEADEAILRCCQIALAEEKAIVRSGKSWLLRRRQRQPNQKGSSQQQPRSTATPSTTDSSRPDSRHAASGSKPVATAANLNSAAPTSTQSTGRNTTFKCYNCGGAGHMSRDCRKGARASLNMFDALSDDTTESEKEEPKK
jgi:hypothetical protein